MLPDVYVNVFIAPKMIADDVVRFATSKSESAVSDFAFQRVVLRTRKS